MNGAPGKLACKCGHKYSNMEIYLCENNHSHFLSTEQCCRHEKQLAKATKCII